MQGYTVSHNNSISKILNDSRFEYSWWKHDLQWGLQKSEDSAETRENVHKTEKQHS